MCDCLNMAQVFATEHQARLAHLKSRITQAQVYLQAKLFDDWSALELQTRHLSNNIKRMQTIMQQATENNCDQVTYRATAETLLKVDDLLTKLNMHLEHAYQANTVPAFSPPQPKATKHLELKIPVFTGARSKYHSFKQAINIVCDRKQAQPAERLLYLIEHLDQKITKPIENLPLDESGLKLA